MKNFITALFVLISILAANPSIAFAYYYQQAKSNQRIDLITGDPHFSYSFSKTNGYSEEVIERELTRVTVIRSNTVSTLWVEQRTKFGYLYQKYKAAGNNWEIVESTFKRYETFFRDDADNACESLPTKKNQHDITAISNSIEKQNFANLIFEKNCHEKLNETEINHLVDSTYSLLTAESNTLAVIKDPRILSCVTLQGKESKIRNPFRQLQKNTSDLIKNSKSIDDIKNNVSVPFPISCDFNSKEKKHCGSVTEGKKAKISFDVRCLKENKNASQQKVISMFMHEFAHTIRSPKSLSEEQVQKLELGNCNPQDVVFAGDKETNISKDKVVASENSKQSGAKTIAGDVVNPYSAFVETPQAPSASQGTRIATNAPAATEVSDTSIASRTSTQRSVASVGTFANTASSFSVNTNIPTMQQQAQYQNVKAYVDNSVGVVAKKIAPIVSYVESPAFAATLPPSSFANSNSGNNETSDTEIPKSATAAKARSASASASSNNEVSSGAGGSSSSVSLGTSSSSGNSTRSPAAINRNAARGSVATGLDNAYALKVRKRLISESSYREELRSKGIQIEFADGYKFETQGSKIQYTEQNGVLVRGK